MLSVQTYQVLLNSRKEQIRLLVGGREVIWHVKVLLQQPAEVFLDTLTSTDRQTNQDKPENYS